MIEVMSRALKLVPAAGAILLGGLAGLVLIDPAGAQDTPAAMKSARGGLLAKTERNQFEIFFYPTGIRLFPMDSTGKPVDATNLSATATFYHPASAAAWFDRPLQPAPVEGGAAPTSLMLSIGLESIPTSGVKVVVDVSGLADSPTFTVPFEFVAGQAPSASSPTGAAANPRFIYGSGIEGFGYYANPGPDTPPRPAAATAAPMAAPPRFTGSTGTRSGSVGPGTRNWATGNRSPLHRPWLRSMN